MAIPLIPIDRIGPDPRNAREDLGDLSELTASLLSVGLLQPLVLRPAVGGKRFVIVDGHRRYAAAKAAGLSALPAVATRARDRAGQLAVMLAAAMHKELTPVERAQAFGRLRDLGLTVAETSARTGYSTRTIRDGLALLELPAPVLEQVTTGTITAKDAVAIARELRAGRSGTARHRETRSTWFHASHPLAATVRASCTHTQTRRPVGGAGCGQCWEAAIRADERTKGTPP